MSAADLTDRLVEHALAAAAQVNAEIDTNTVNRWRRRGFYQLSVDIEEATGFLHAASLLGLRCARLWHGFHVARKMSEFIRKNQ